MRAAGNSRFGFPWSPRNLADMPPGDFNAQTDALLVRLAAAIADSAQAPDAACSVAWCSGTLDGASATTAWRTFGAWKPSFLAFTTPAQTLSPGVPSAPLTVELRTSNGTPYTAGLSVPMQLSSSSPTSEFSTTGSGPWTVTLATSIASGQSATSVYYRDAVAGSATITAAATGKTAAVQAVTISADTTPPAPPPSAGGPPPPEPADGAPAVVTPVASPVTSPPTPPPPKLRVVGTGPAVVKRHGSRADALIRFSVSDAARLNARVTALRSTQAIALLPGTTFAGKRSITTLQTATTSVPRGGTYSLRARLRAARLVRGHSYLVRLTAIYSGGRRLTLSIRIRA
jgi:hypothetical protein